MKIFRLISDEKRAMTTPARSSSASKPLSNTTNIKAKVSLNNPAELRQVKCLILIEMLEKDRSEKPVLHSIHVETGAEVETEFYNHRLLLKSL